MTARGRRKIQAGPAGKEEKGTAASAIRGKIRCSVTKRHKWFVEPPASMRTRLSALLLASLAATLTSCVYTSYPGYSEYGIGRVTGGYSYGSSGYPWIIDRGYRYYCPICRSYNCRGSHSRHDYDRYADYFRQEERKHREGSYRIASGNTGRKSTPSGYHSPEWFRSRGYDINHLRLEDEFGDSYRRSGSSKSSGGGHSHSSSSRESHSKSSSRSGGHSSSSKSQMNHDNPRLRSSGKISDGKSSSHSSRGGGKSSDSKSGNSRRR